MADINQVITLGIGDPASIKFFMTFGLGIKESLPVVKSFKLANRSVGLSLWSRDIDYELNERDITFTLDKDDRQ